MKKILALMAFAAIATGAPQAHAVDALDLNTAMVKNLVQNINPLDLVKWKVGDATDYDVSLASMGKMGTMTKSVTKEEGDGLWVHQEANLMIQKDVSDMLISKADGKILKFIHNGKEETPPDEKIEVISQDYTQITVPAGTFKAMHIVAKTAQVDHMEVWANPKDTCMDGTLKAIVQAQGQNVTLELTSFKKMP